jgi:hypothetical protein
MRIFISWSKDYSKAVALAMSDWLKDVFPGIETFVSDVDIRKGARWGNEIVAELNKCNFGLVCLTPDNLKEPWIHFESGALSKQLTNSALYTFLVGGLQYSNIDGPLQSFNHTIANKEDVYKLVIAINEAQKQAKREEARLRTAFEKYYGDLEATLEKARESAPASKAAPAKPEIGAMLEKILETTAYIAKNLPAESLESVGFGTLIANQLRRQSLQANPAALELAEFLTEQSNTFNSPIEFIGLGNPYVAKLRGAGVNTVGKLSKLTADTLSTVYAMDSAAINLVEQQLRKRGLHLANVKMATLPGRDST